MAEIYDEPNWRHVPIWMWALLALSVVLTVYTAIVTVRYSETGMRQYEIERYVPLPERGTQ